MHRIVGTGDFLALNQHTAKEMIGEIKAQSAASPIVAGGHRSCFVSSLGGQDRPENEKIEVARVIGKVNALAIIGRTSQPTGLNTGEESHAGSKQFRNHADSSCRA